MSTPAHRTMIAQRQFESGRDGLRHRHQRPAALTKRWRMSRWPKPACERPMAAGQLHHSCPHFGHDPHQESQVAGRPSSTPWRSARRPEPLRDGRPRGPRSRIGHHRTDVSKVIKGMPCRVPAQEAYPDRPYDGVVDRLMPIANRAKGAVLFRVKVRVPDEEAMPEDGNGRRRGLFEPAKK